MSLANSLRAGFGKSEMLDLALGDQVLHGAGDVLEPSGGWIETRYAAKSRREGRAPHQFRYRRR